MRIARVIFACPVAALVVMTTPALAKSSVTQQGDDKSTSSVCHAYEQAPDGTWSERPCEEQGAPAQTQHKPVARGTEEEPR